MASSPPYDAQPCEVSAWGPSFSPAASSLKRRRLNQTRTPSTTPASSPSSPSSPTSPSSDTTFNTLPPEILAIILDFSLEASLIHTSRRTWTCLPSYVHYTKTLALRAMIQMDDVLQSQPSQAHEIDLLKRTLDPDVQNHIRRAVFSSAWFTEHHLNCIHRILLNWTILQCCSWYGDNSPSRYQRQRIKYFIERQSAPSSSAVLYLRVHSSGKRMRYLSAKQLSVTVSGCPFVRPQSSQVLDFGDCVPDDLLRLPFTSSKAVLIRGLCKPIWIPRDDNSLSCNRRLLHHAMLESIAFHHVEHFHILLSLEERSRKAKNQDQTVLDLELIRHAVIHGRSGMLIRILKQLWTCPGMIATSALDLVGVMDEAERNQYPDYQNIVRVLAMEVAAKWKMAEIESSGRTAHRVAMDWPPRLIYRLPDSHDTQIWFIPRDYHHDVDWEASLDIPWLPLYVSV